LRFATNNSPYPEMDRDRAKVTIDSGSVRIGDLWWFLSQRQYYYAASL